MSNIKVIADKDEIVAIADAVRNKTSSSEKMDGLVGIVNAINEIGIAGGGSAVVTGEIIVSGSLVIPEIIGKENVLLSFMDNATLDSIGGSRGVAYVWSVFIANDSILYCIQYDETNLSAYNDNLLIYDKVTGAINFNEPYNELFYPGKYRYVAW